MKANNSEIECRLLIIGSGLTGMAAAVFAAQHGIDTVQVGLAGELGFASGFLDLLGVHPVSTGRVWKSPWDGIDALVQQQPDHPYARLSKAEIKKALDRFLTFLDAGGLPYFRNPEGNVRTLTPAGTVKTTHAVPASVKNGVKALAAKAPTLIVDFHGLKGFSGRQIVALQKKSWPKLTSRRIPFLDRTGELLPERMAISLEQETHRAQLADAIRPHLADADYVGLPAILGLYRPKAVFEDVERRLGRHVFEIPTIPPSISGLRLKNVFEQTLPRQQVRTFYQFKVLSVDDRNAQGFRFSIGRDLPLSSVKVKSVILASGRFIGGGLHADRKAVRETIFGLPVHQIPAHDENSRTHWHKKAMFDPQGHPINRFGVTTDRYFRPLDKAGQPDHPGLFAAGSILAHQDWIRQKCGAGLAIATAHAAVTACNDYLAA